MARQLTFFELLRLLFSLLIAAIVYSIAGVYGESISYDDPGTLGTLSYLFLAIFVPAFLAVFVAPILPSWRYKMITATLVLNAITLWTLVDAAQSFTGLWPLAGAMIRLSGSMTGALIAILIWKSVKNRWMKRAAAKPFTGQPATALPKTSTLLLWLSLLSIPITYITIFASAFLVLGYSALLLLLLSEMSRVPIIVIAAALLAPLVAGWVSLRALAAQFLAKPEFQPAQTIPLAERPLLRQMVKEICSTVGSREPDNVILHIKPTFFVTQQKLKTFNSIVRGRTLAMGMPFLPLLTRQELKAVLAHEFAHFSGRDTAYSVWVSPVYRSLGESITRLQKTTSSADNRLQVLINLLLFPSLLFLIVFYEYFAAIDAIISRSREFRADWIAASHYGSDAFISALKKIVQYGAYFSEQQAQLSLDQESEFQEHYRILAPVEPNVFERHLEQAMSARENEFDSHPTLPSRIGNVPVTAAQDDETNEAIEQELGKDEEALSVAYATTMKQLKELYARYQAQYLPKNQPQEQAQK